LDEYGETFLAQTALDGERRRSGAVFGSAKYAGRIQVDPKALAARGIGLDQRAVSAGNPNLPTGTLWGRGAYTVLADGSISSAPESASLP